MGVGFRREEKYDGRSVFRYHKVWYLTGRFSHKPVSVHWGQLESVRLRR